MLTRTKLFGLPCLLLLCCTLPHLDQGDFHRDSGRYATVGLYMWTDGQVGVPYVNPDTPDFTKPPLAIAIHGLFLKLFNVHLAVARIPSVLAALGVVILSVLTLALIASRVEALVSGLVLATTYEFFRRTREVSLDFWQLFFVMLGIYLVVRSLKRGKPAGLLLAGVPFGLALLCKPLVALGIIPVLAVWAVIMKERRGAIWLLTGTPAVALIVAAPWHLYMWSLFGPAFIQKYFGYEVIGRLEGNMATRPFPYYFVLISQTYWPWLLAVAWAVWKRWPRPETAQGRKSPDAVLLGFVWVGCGLLALSLFPDKKPNYALPIYPMLSWVAAAGLCRLPWPWLRTWRSRQFIGLAPATAGLLVLLSVLPIRFQSPPGKDWPALFRWMQEQHIPPASLCYWDVDKSERMEDFLCDYYLKAGVFPRRLPFGAGPLGDFPLFVLVQISPDTDTTAMGAMLFRSGFVAVVPSAGSKPEPLRQRDDNPAGQAAR
jgi:4-amino-4-deoxy-L-arabinose transferase-like glycosyltransferase